ncbi:MAG: F0F1 ATP synthase subunit epsilon [Butyribacter sp.]|nr:F0F1 ATP synthase subunit epsilon [bacterium]MDY3854536.1 F0F1 ATP synthase subunit epsilon [Butyribacter sp.]
MADKTFNLQIISPTRIFFDGDVTMVEMKTTEGEIGVLAGHIPLTAIIEPGVIKIRQEDEVKEAALHDGFVKIQKDNVVILAESCEWPDEIDVERAKEAKERAERRLKSGKKEVDVLRAELALKKAITRINLAGK